MKSNSEKPQLRSLGATGKARATVPFSRVALEHHEKSRWIGRTVSKGTRRDAILHSVGAVLRDSRLSSLTMQDIAIQLGITKGNLYYYFKDKQDILFQCHMPPCRVAPG